MTPIALSFDSENVYLSDEHLVVLAWGGGGTSKIANFLEDRSFPNEESRLRVIRMCESMRDNEAGNDVVRIATSTFPRFQTFITNFFGSVGDTV